MLAVFHIGSLIVFWFLSVIVCVNSSSAPVACNDWPPPESAKPAPEKNGSPDLYPEYLRYSIRLSFDALLAVSCYFTGNILFPSYLLES